MKQLEMICEFQWPLMDDLWRQKSVTFLNGVHSTATLRKRGISTSQSDTMIVAITFVNHAALVTRNEKDFSNFGIKVINSFSESRSSLIEVD